MIATALIEAHLDVQPVVYFSDGDEHVELDVRAELRNTSDHDYVLHAATDDAHFWHVLDENHREILRKKEYQRRQKTKAGAPLPARGHTLAAGHSTHESRTLSLDATKLKEGRVYTVRSELWGLVAEGTFVAVKASAEGKASLPEKKPPKKAPPKKAAPRKKK
ncbi:MAG: hypothetical protein R3247_03165 [Rhodothermales bacterium]|nr:hypothetical protein [Rhodothermales bacterium]